MRRYQQCNHYPGHGESQVSSNVSEMQCFSSSQSPRSMRRQRSLQKGRHCEAEVQATGLPQVGQGTLVGGSWVLGWSFIVSHSPLKTLQNMHAVSRNSTSRLVCTGLLLSAVSRNRMLKRCLLPLISVKTVVARGKPTRINCAGAELFNFC